MNSNNCKKIISTIIAIIFFLIFLPSTIYFFKIDKLTTEFIAMFCIISLVSLIILYFPEISEISIGGNIIKLKDIKQDAVNEIKKLKQSQIITFKFLLSLAKRLPGGFGSCGITKDERLNDFWFIYNEILNFQIENELKNNIIDVATLLAQGQLKVIEYHSDGLSLSRNGDLPDINYIMTQGFVEQKLKENAERTHSDIEKVKEKFLKSAEEYRKIYEKINYLKGINN